MNPLFSQERKKLWDACDLSSVFSVFSVVNSLPFPTPLVPISEISGQKTPFPFPIRAHLCSSVVPSLFILQNLIFNHR